MKSFNYQGKFPSYTGFNANVFPVVSLVISNFKVFNKNQSNLSRNIQINPTENTKQQKSAPKSQKSKNKKKVEPNNPKTKN